MTENLLKKLLAAKEFFDKQGHKYDKTAYGVYMTCQEVGRAIDALKAQENRDSDDLVGFIAKRDRS